MKKIMICIINEIHELFFVDIYRVKKKRQIQLMLTNHIVKLIYYVRKLPFFSIAGIAVLDNNNA